MTTRSALKTLLVLAVALPIVQAVLFWVAGLLSSMGDASGAALAQGVGTACLVVWTVALVGLVILTAFTSLSEKDASTKARRNELEEDLE